MFTDILRFINTMHMLPGCSAKGLVVHTLRDSYGCGGLCMLLSSRMCPVGCALCFEQQVWLP